MYAINRRTCGGFTMVELVLVILIGGVLAAVAVPRMVDRSAFQTRGGAAEVRTALRYAQRLAMAKNREVCVTTAAIPAPNLKLSFSLISGGPCDQPVVRSDGSRNPDNTPDYVVTPPAGIALTSSLPVFRFDGQGRPITTPPNTSLVASVDFMVGGTITVKVLPETGYVQ